MIAEAILNRLATRLSRALAPPRGPLVPLIVEGCTAGLVDEHRARRLVRFAGVFEAAAGGIRFARGLDAPALRSAALARVARTLHDEGSLTRWRDERYAVSASPDAPALFEIERAAARYFGIATQAAHLNATTIDREGTPRMWIARRSADKAIDPGQLDNLVGGGVAAGTTIAQTLAREAAEEAGISLDLASQARPCGSLRILRAQPDGLQRETIHTHDLVVPPDFSPCNADGEVAEFRLASIEGVARWAGNDSGDELMTADAALVVADWLLRHDYVAPGTAAWTSLDRLRRDDTLA